MMSTSHLYKSSSSTRPAENPSTGFRWSSVTANAKRATIGGGEEYHTTQYVRPYGKRQLGTRKAQKNSERPEDSVQGRKPG